MNKQERQARRIVRERSGGCCEMCGAQASEFHHRKNRSQGGPWSASNGLHLCSKDHRWVTEHPAAAVDHGWSVRSWMDPAEVPVTIRPGSDIAVAFLLDDEGGRTQVEVSDV